MRMRSKLSAATLSTLGAAVVAAGVSSAPAAARDFKADLAGPVGAAITEVNVRVDEAIIAPQSFGRRNLINQRTIGPRDAEDVSEQIDRVLTRRLVDDALTNASSGVSGATLNVVVTRVLATDLRFTEYGRRNNLAFGSRQAGGAEFVATLEGPDGRILGEFAYDRFEPFIGFNSLGVGTWYDANRAAQFFGARIEDAIEDATPTL